MTDMTRKQCVTRLAELGYDGPTSYLMPRLRQIVVETEAAAKPKRTRAKK